MRKEQYFKILDKLYHKSPVIRIDENDRIVIFSDLHLGNRSSRDDFLQNSDSFYYILQNYYNERKYKLFLNGDVEELYKFKIKNVYSAWKKLYDLFEEFDRDDRLCKIIGNHDYDLNRVKFPDLNKKAHKAVRLSYNDNPIFIFHGHQTAGIFEQYNMLAYLFVRYIVRPLGIKNPTFSMSNREQFLTEIRAYQYASSHKLLTILGHTHRPLFESLSKFDDLKMRIETLIRKYSKANSKQKHAIENRIKEHKDELRNLLQSDRDESIRSSIYDESLLIPCLFNSGSVIGKRGFTGIEISKGKVSLVYWFDRKRSKRYLDYKKVKSKQFQDTDYFKAILKRESLEYVFTRIKLLA